MRVAGYVVVILLVLLVVGVALALRRLRVIRAGGVHVALRRRIDASGRGWRLGIGHYRGDEFLWYRVLGVSTKADQVITRAGLQIATRRAPGSTETYAMPAGAGVLQCHGVTGVDVELAMGEDALTGFLSWLESSPPGRHAPWASY
ncbi:MAG: DUF2550 domain-containing protein [Sciscionella sp.]